MDWPRTCSPKDCSLWRGTPGEGDNRQISPENRGVGDAQCGRGGHGVSEDGLHNQPGNGKTGSGYERRQHPGEPDVSHDSHICGAAPARQSLQHLGHRHPGRTRQHAQSRRQKSRNCKYDKHLAGFSVCFYVFGCHSSPPFFHLKFYYTSVPSIWQDPRFWIC